MFNFFDSCSRPELEDLFPLEKKLSLSPSSILCCLNMISFSKECLYKRVILFIPLIKFSHLNKVLSSLVLMYACEKLAKFNFCKTQPTFLNYQNVTEQISHTTVTMQFKPPLATLHTLIVFHRTSI